MTISATKILHSISNRDIELKSVLARYPRFIHAEELTYRILSSSPDMIIEINDGVMYDRNLSRNASSSRAIPVKRLIDDILFDTAMPISWGKNQKGMQAGEEHNAMISLPDHGEFTMDGMGFSDGSYGTRENLSMSPQDAWHLARDRAIEIARGFDAAGYHKQVVNRLLEPFSHINVLITATDWDNFFELRDHEDAQPEIQVLAQAIKAAFADSKPQLLQPGEWHLPFITLADKMAFEDDLETWKKISVARCAGTSYLTHDGLQPLPEKDLELYEQLVGARPLHASPAEHQATPDLHNHLVGGWERPSLHGNFRGFVQNRKILELAAA